MELPRFVALARGKDDPAPGKKLFATGNSERVLLRVIVRNSTTPKSRRNLKQRLEQNTTESVEEMGPSAPVARTLAQAM